MTAIFFRTFTKFQRCPPFQGDIGPIGSDNHLGDGVKDEGAVSGGRETDVHDPVQPTWSQDCRINDIYIERGGGV